MQLWMNATRGSQHHSNLLRLSAVQYYWIFRLIVSKNELCSLWQDVIIWAFVNELFDICLKCGNKYSWKCIESVLKKCIETRCAVLCLPQAMHLVYRALEKEPVPPLLPSALIPPSKRKKSLGSVTGSVPGLPASPPPPKDSLRSTPSHGSMNSLNSTGSLSPKHTLKSGQVIHSVHTDLSGWRTFVFTVSLGLSTES